MAKGCVAPLRFRSSSYSMQWGGGGVQSWVGRMATDSKIVVMLHH
jgi:hypothetical protein